MSKIIFQRFSFVQARYVCLVFFLVAGIWSSLRAPQHPQTIPLTLSTSPFVELSSTETMGEDNRLPTYEYVVQSGDTLGALFLTFNFSYATLMSVLDADSDVFALENLKLGKRLLFWQDDVSGELVRLEWKHALGTTAVYQRVEDGSFQYSEVLTPGVWRQESFGGLLGRHFDSSMKRFGIREHEVHQIAALLEGKVNLPRDLQSGDEFEIVRRTLFIDGEPTDETRLDGVKVVHQSNEFAAYLHSDGRYYTAEGEAFERAFLRHPVSPHFSVSSGFNLSRRHPVTGRIMPHKGTDFSVPIGTPVMATSEGVVILTRQHPYAGNYVVIKHDGRYKTRYLHLSQISVVKGEKVTRGQRIGLSGQTGRVTGAHLHYELLEYGRPVDPMSAKVPRGKGIPDSELAMFHARRDTIATLLDEHTTRT